MNKDWIGNSRSVYSTLGASSHTEEDRETHDYYATDPKASELLLEIEDFSEIRTIWDNSVGQGHLMKPFEERAFNIIGSDLIKRELTQLGYNTTGTTEHYTEIDFLKIKENSYPFINRVDAIIMNPPYNQAQEFVEHSMELLPVGGKLFAFLKLQFLEGKKRKSLFTKYPPETVWVSTSRLLCAKNGEFTGESSAVCYCWYVWTKYGSDEQQRAVVSKLGWFN